MLQQCKFSDFCLILEYFTSIPVKLVCEMSSLEHVSRDFNVDSDFQEKYYFRLYH